MAWTYNGTIIRAGRSWADDDGIKHPTNWGSWSDEEKEAAGLVWQDDPAPYDNRFWWDADTPKALDDVNEVDENGDPVLDQDGNQVVTLGLKSAHKKIVKQQAGNLLSDTDWYIVREAETAEETPQAVLDYRAAVRAASGAIESAIDGAADHAAFVALFDAPTDADGNVTGNAPINDWPKA